MATSVSIVIPTLNEEATLPDILERCLLLGHDILVIDGHSTDGTRDVAKKFGVRYELDEGKGKGAALRKAVELLQSEILVFIDADGSHVPEDIPKLIDPLLQGHADLVVASRLLGGSSEFHGGFDEFLRFSGSSFITACINWRYDVCISDSQNGFRAIKRDVFRGLGLTSNLTTIEQEMTMKTLAAGYRVEEIPSHEYRRKGGVSKVRVFSLWHKYVASLTMGMLYEQKGVLRKSSDQVKLHSRI